MPRITIGDYLITRLKEPGIEHLIGVPGDFNLAFLEQVLAHDGMEWVGACNELNAAYAADGYARMRGAGALLVTYGVGDLSALNGIAGAAAEHVPVICISGVPPLDAIRNRHVLHHTAGTGGFEDVMNCLAQFTAAQARITPANAAIEIDRLVRTALREKQPVYLQLPSDISYLEIDAPLAPLAAYAPTGDTAQTALVVELLAERITRAKRPALLVDADTHRFGLRPLICALGERAQLPFASMASGRSIFNEQHPLYRGIYSGEASSAETLETIEGSDCLIAIGVRFFDATTCYFSHRLEAQETIVLDPFCVTIDGRTFEGVTAKEVLAGLLERLPVSGVSGVSGVGGVSGADADLVTSHPLPVEAVLSQVPKCEGPGAPTFLDSAKLTHARLWPRLARFLREGDVILAESGTSQSGLSGIRIPAHCTFISQTTWGSIGYTLPALLGSLLAEPERRQLLFIGDGSLQMTAQEISTMLRHGFKPIIFVVNNYGYTIERVILGPHSEYNDIQNWKYTALPAAFADGQDVRTYRVTTEGELERALEEIEATAKFTLVELVMDKLDAPAGLRKMGPLVADYDFGARGPQVTS
jgi:indolepyruvate decarboxylase